MGDDEPSNSEPAAGQLRAAALLQMLAEANNVLAEVDVPDELCCPLTMEPMVKCRRLNAESEARI